MNKYIYKIKNKIVSGDEENPVITYTDIEPKLLACVPVVEPTSYTTTNEEGEEITVTPKLEISKHFPSWDETMVMSDVQYKEPKLIEGKLIEGYVAPKPQEPVPVPEPTPQENLSRTRARLLDIQTEIIIAERLGFGYDIIKLEEEKEVLIQDHKKLSELVAKGE